MTTRLKRTLSVDVIDTQSADNNDPPTTQAKKRNRRGTKGKELKGLTTQSQPTKLVMSDVEVDDNDDINLSPCCIICNEEGTESSTIQCESCEQFYHLICYGIEEADHSVIKRLIRVIGWSCKVCRDDVLNEINKLRKDFSKLDGKLSNEVKQGKSEMFKIIGESIQRHPSMQRPDLEPTTGDAIQNTVNELPPAQIDYAGVVRLVQKSVSDVNNRQRNVIITGLRERDGYNDTDLFIRLCEDELGVKPLTHRDSTRRLGKASGVGPRKLLVRLTSESAAMDLIFSSRKLRDSKDPYVASKIYINRDLTKEQAKQAFERRQSRRQAAAASSSVHHSGGHSSPRGTGAIRVRASSLTFVNSFRKNTGAPSNSSLGGDSSSTVVVDNTSVSAAQTTMSNPMSIPMSNPLCNSITSVQLNPTAVEFNVNSLAGNSHPAVDQCVANTNTELHS